MTDKRQKIIILAALGLVILIAASLTAYVVHKRDRAVLDSTREIFSESAGHVTYTDLSGRQLSLEDYLGKVLVVVSWASWSPFSAADLQNLNDLASSYSPEDVVFIAMNRKETKEQAARYLVTLPEFTHLTLVIDTEDKFYSAVAGYAMPESLVFNQKGEIILHDRGVTNIEHIKSVIETARVTE